MSQSAQDFVEDLLNAEQAKRYINMNRHHVQEVLLLACAKQHEKSSRSLRCSSAAFV